MKKRYVKAAYTVEATGVLGVIFFTVMILINQAFLIHGEAVGGFQLHLAVEQARHAIENIDEDQVTRQEEGNQWSLELTAPVFRPEKDLRMWSLAEDLT